jgi:Transposase IS4
LGIQCESNPPESPDLNPIETIWRTIKQRLKNRGLILDPTELRRAIEEEWDKITLKEINEAISTMPDRVAAVNERDGLPIAIGPLPETAELDEKDLPELPTYEPPLNLQFQASKSLATGLSEFQTFQQLLTPQIIGRIVAATNSYAINAQNKQDLDEELKSYARLWKSVNSIEIWRFIGYLLYIGVHKEVRHEEHWSKTGYLSKFMSLIRYEQIHRYFTLRDGAIDPKKEETFMWQVEPVTTIVKRNCRALWSPSSHLAVDEAMIAPSENRGSDPD